MNHTQTPQYDRCIKNASVYQNGAFHNLTIYIKDNRIARITGENASCSTSNPGTSDILPATEIIDATGLKIIPGMIETHIHGAVGIDINEASIEDLETLSSYLCTQGTTAWIASILSDAIENTLHCIDTLVEYQKYMQEKQSKSQDQKLIADKIRQKSNKSKTQPVAELLGIHMEGPFLSPKYKGAMPESYLKMPDIDLMKKYVARAHGMIRYVTLAPELDGALDLIDYLISQGIRVGIGHTDASYDQVMEAIRHGAGTVTHMGNGMHPLHHREPSVMGALNDSNVYCELIADGHHLDPAYIRILAKLVGTDRLIGITDAMMAAGCPDGNYHLGANDVTVKNSVARLSANGALAGSTLSQIQALKNLMEYLNLPLESVIPIFTENPAREMGFIQTRGTIEEGKRADLILLDDTLRIHNI